MTPQNNATVIRSFGQVERVVGNSLAYVSIDGDGRTLSFIPSVLENYRGESFEERQITEGASVILDWLSSSGVVTRVSLAESGSRPGTEAPLHTIKTRGPTGRIQCELHPDRSAKQGTAVLRALPIATRTFGKLIDTSSLGPGDLLLSRELKPDKISLLITNVQRDGGYHADDARWTHAAMYVGDGASVVEATFDSVLGGGSVRLTSLDEYSQGVHSLRFRRSKYILDEREGWRVCVRAMSRLGKPYDFLQAALMWFNVVIRGGGFFSSDMRRSTSSAVICSMLYADSYNEATRRSLGEVSGVCVPAWLSTSDEFDDIQAEWSQIGSEVIG